VQRGDPLLHLGLHLGLQYYIRSVKSTDSSIKVSQSQLELSLLTITHISNKITETYILP